jgi:hypothetical protein
VGAVRLDRLWANPQRLSNFPVLEAIPDVIEHLLLALRQRDNAA